MPRRKTHAPLNVFINGRKVGRLMKAADGATSFQYDDSWLQWDNGFAISLSLPMRDTAYQGKAVIDVFDNLLPDNPNIRNRVAERMGAEGRDYYSLLEVIGRDCVGAMQFIPDDMLDIADTKALWRIEAKPLSNDAIEKMLAGLKAAPLGVDREEDFRISVSGAQEKTALLWRDGQWQRPVGTTPTTHIFKPQLGEIPTASGVIDMTASVDNEHYCLKLMEAFGLDVAQTDIATFGDRRVLVVKRFDRFHRDKGDILRLPQEDFCQALGIASTQKYQSNGGPSAVQILKLLQGADDPVKDQTAFFKSQILFWLMGATDGHGKNFSIALGPGGRYHLTPFYDVLSAQTAVDKRQIQRNRYKLAMSAGKSRHYRVLEIAGRHFVETGKEAGLGSTVIRNAITEILEAMPNAADDARAQMPGDFNDEVHESIRRAMQQRRPLLEAALQEL